MSKKANSTKRPPGADWCVTGINRLSRVREVITPPCQKAKAVSCVKSKLRLSRGNGRGRTRKSGVLRITPPISEN